MFHNFMFAIAGNNNHLHLTGTGHLLNLFGTIADNFLCSMSSSSFLKSFESSKKFLHFLKTFIIIKMKTKVVIVLLIACF